MKITAPGDCSFDSGAGPGIDAKFYAERGFKVIAYDADSRMCASFAQHRQLAIESGQIHLCQAEYRDFIDLQVAAIRVREVTILDFQSIGSHTLFVGRICSAEPLRQSAQLFHTSGIHQQLRIRHTRPFQVALTPEVA